MHYQLSKLSHLKLWIIALGGPGLLLIAFLDSSFLSFPEINDILIIANSFHNVERMLYYATMTTIGSVLGCTVLYWVGRRGGNALLKKRFDPKKVAKVRGWYDRYGLLAVIIPSILPPPTPFKLFVISAGVFEIPVWRFVLAVAVGRSFRYFLEGYLAVQVGQHAMDWMKSHYPLVAASIVLTIVGLFVVYLLMLKKGDHHPE